LSGKRKSRRHQNSRQENRRAPIQSELTPIVSNQEHHSEPSTEEDERQAPISDQTLVDRINRSDRWMIGLTTVIAAGGIISAVIFGWQLSIMKGQLDEMHVASALTRLQSRANIKPLNFTPELSNGDWKILPTWQNQGPTNADDFEQWISWATTLKNEKDPDFSKPGQDPGRLPRVSVGPNSPQKGDVITIPIDRIQEVVAGTRTLYLWGRASYHDIFFTDNKLEHLTVYCTRMVIPDPKNTNTASFYAYKADCNYAR
jgi:hypothetical protein